MIDDRLLDRWQIDERGRKREKRKERKNERKREGEEGRKKKGGREHRRGGEGKVCFNNISQTRWFKNITVQTRSLKSKCWPSRLLVEERLFSAPLPASLGCQHPWWSLACNCTPPFSASFITSIVFLCLHIQIFLFFNNIDYWIKNQISPIYDLIFIC